MKALIHSKLALQPCNAPARGALPENVSDSSAARPSLWHVRRNLTLLCSALPDNLNILFEIAHRPRRTTHTSLRRRVSLAVTAFKRMRMLATFSDTFLRALNISLVVTGPSVPATDNKARAVQSNDADVAVCGRLLVHISITASSTIACTSSCLATDSAE